MIRILFVDDDPKILSGFRVVLHAKRKEWETSFASSGEEGLELLKSQSFDVIIADMRMPVMNGAHFLLKVKDIRPDAIRIILSGYSETESVLESVKPAHQFLSKPCSSEVLMATIERAANLKNILTDERIRSVLGQLESLPALPDVFMKIEQELHSGSPSMQRVGQLVEQDMGISASILKVVNSSFFGLYKKITSPSHAVTLLGSEIIKGLVLGVQFIQLFDVSESTKFSIKQLWAHCLETGAFAKTIAREEALPEDACNKAFIAGLLHDIGKLVLVTQLRDEYGAVLDRMRTEHVSAHRAEMDALGVSHAEVGAYLLGTWGMDEDVVKHVHGHHAPACSREGIAHGLIVHAANYLQHELASQGPGRNEHRLDVDALASAGLAERMEHWRAACEEQSGRGSGTGEQQP